MSEMVVKERMLVCDWPGCQEMVQGGSFEWLHTEDGQDYCPKHWHWEGNDPTPGTGSESGHSWGKSTEEAARSMETMGQAFASAGTDPREEA